MILGTYKNQNYYSVIYKKNDMYQRSVQHGPGAKKQILNLTEMEAAEWLAYSDVDVCDHLKEAKNEKYKFQAILGELMEM